MECSQVTAEAYQPTTQACELVGKNALVDAKAGGEAALAAESGLTIFKVNFKDEKSADMSYFVSRVHDLAKPYEAPPCGEFRHVWPYANRGAAAPRKFHLKGFLERQRQAAVPFATVARDFQLLMYVAPLLPPKLLASLCKSLPLVAKGSTASKRARDDAATAIGEVESWLCDYAGVA